MNNGGENPNRPESGFGLQIQNISSVASGIGSHGKHGSRRCILQDGRLKRHLLHLGTNRYVIARAQIHRDNDRSPIPIHLGLSSRDFDPRIRVPL